MPGAYLLPGGFGKLPPRHIVALSGGLSTGIVAAITAAVPKEFSAEKLPFSAEKPDANQVMPLPGFTAPSKSPIPAKVFSSSI